MLDVETLQTIIAELDEESSDNFNANGSPKKKSLRKNRAEEKNSKFDVKPVEVEDEDLTRIKAENTEQMKIYKQLLRMYGTFGFFFGISFKLGYRWNPTRQVMFWVANTYLFFTVFLFLYNVSLHVRDGDYAKIVQPLAIMGMMISCLVKWHCHLTKWRKIYSLIFMPKKLCMVNVTGVRAEIISAGLQKTVTVLTLYTVGVILCLCFFVLVPIKFYFVDHIVMDLLPVEIPFCDQSTTSGFIISRIIQTQIGIYGGIGTIMFGSGFLICISNHQFLMNLVEEDFKYLDKMWDGSSTTSVAYRHAFLFNICRKVQDMKSYMRAVNVIYEWKFFAYFINSYIAQIICLYEVVQDDWIPGYSFALICFIEMMSYCLIGHQIEIGDNAMCDILNRTNWYRYDLTSQRVFALIIHERQRPNVIMLGSLGPLNVTTGIKILKGIYSYFTVLMEVM